MMRVSQLLRSILILFVCCLAMSLASAQNSTELQNESTTKDEKTSIYEYADTPEYIFIRRKNFFKNLNELQLEILDTYDYPKYISTNDRYQKELDIISHWKRVEEWETDNADRIEEIMDALGMRK